MSAGIASAIASNCFSSAVTLLSNAYRAASNSAGLAVWAKAVAAQVNKIRAVNNSYNCFILISFSFQRPERQCGSEKPLAALLH
jgi:hypothetical protein